MSLLCVPKLNLFQFWSTIRGGNKQWWLSTKLLLK